MVRGAEVQGTDSQRERGADQHEGDWAVNVLKITPSIRQVCLCACLAACIGCNNTSHKKKMSKHISYVALLILFCFFFSFCNQS